MNVTTLKALRMLVPTLLLMAGAILVFLKEREKSSLLQLLGASSLVLVVLTHICEGLDLFPAMRWGEEQRAGHNVPVGYLLQALKTKVG
jgi:hypothetical protein